MKSFRAAEPQLFGAGAFGDAYLPVHEYLYISGPALLGQRLRQLGHQVLADYPRKYFRETILNLFVTGAFNRGCVRIMGMQAESTAWLGFNVEVEVEFLASGGKFPEEDWSKIPSQGAADVGLGTAGFLACKRPSGGVGIVGVGMNHRPGGLNAVVNVLMMRLRSTVPGAICTRLAEGKLRFRITVVTARIIPSPLFTYCQPALCCVVWLCGVVVWSRATCPARNLPPTIQLRAV